MSIRIDLSKELKTCKECDLYLACNLKDMQDNNCPRNRIKEKFKFLYEDEDEEDDDL